MNKPSPRPWNVKKVIDDCASYPMPYWQVYGAGGIIIDDRHLTEANAKLICELRNKETNLTINKKRKTIVHLVFILYTIVESRLSYFIPF